MKTLLLILLAMPSFANATICNVYSESTNDPYYFVESMFNSLGGLNTITKKMKDVPQKEFVFTMTTSFPGMKCVIEELKPFTESSNKSIAESSKHLSAGVASLIEGFQDQIGILKSIEKHELTGEVEVATKMGEAANKVDAAWSVIIMAGISTSEALIDDDQLKKDGKLKALVINEKQRTALVKSIKSDIPIKGKPKFKLELLADQYVKFLNDKWALKKNSEKK
ncbi:hypothetical protein [Bdellovibrio sp. HCB209]|uniref:hypothetical protein n=1 Tax=Bdellovibrio sp. HCB209 TaxID=3394354 RepID=UPI0039B44E46